MEGKNIETISNINQRISNIIERCFNFCQHYDIKYEQSGKLIRQFMDMNFDIILSLVSILGNKDIHLKNDMILGV